MIRHDLKEQRRLLSKASAEVAIAVARKVQLLEVPCRRLAVVVELERSIAAAAADHCHWTSYIGLLVLIRSRSITAIVELLG